MLKCLCEKTRMREVEEKLKKSLLNTLDKTPLLIGSISSQFSGENLLKELGKLVKNPLENLKQNSPQMPQFIGLEKLAVGGLTELSVDRPVDRPTVIFQTVVPSVDRSVDRGQDTESKSLCSVNRSVGQGLSRELSSLDGRPGRSAGPPARTGVHVWQHSGPADRTVDRTRELCSLYLGGRPVAPTVGN